MKFKKQNLISIFLLLLLSFNSILANTRQQNLVSQDKDDKCKPFGEILYQGEYYSEQRDTSNYVTIGINTKDQCSDLVLYLSETGEFQDSDKKEIEASEVRQINTADFTDNQTTYNIFIHYFKLADLVETNKYYYKSSKSDEKFEFILPNVSNDEENQRSFKGNKVIVHGDYDANIKNTNKLTKVDGEWGEYTHKYFLKLKENPDNIPYQLMFLGDYAYDIYTDDYSRGELFFEKAKPYYTQFPNIISIGNHESGGNLENFKFTYVKKYFMSPNQKNTENMSFLTDLVYAQIVNYNGIPIQYYDEKEYQNKIDELESLLKQAQKRRSKERPFIIVISHYPIYFEDDPGNEIETKTYPRFKPVDALLQKYKVDLYLTAHVHNYQRYFPLNDGEICSWANKNQEDSDPKNHYIDAECPVHILDGQAGNAYYQPVADYVDRDILAFQSSNTAGIGMLSITDNKKIIYEHIDTMTSKVIDTVTIEKSSEKLDEHDKDENENGKDSLVIGITIGGVALLIILLFGLFLFRNRMKDQEHHEQNTQLQKLNTTESSQEMHHQSGIELKDTH